MTDQQKYSLVDGFEASGAARGHEWTVPLQQVMTAV